MDNLVSVLTIKLILMKKTLLTFLVATSCFSSIMYGQNIVKNSSFEDGKELCDTNGLFYLGQDIYVDYWTGRNLQQPGATNTGGIWANNASCFFGKFPTGISAPYGNRAINLYMTRSSSITSDARAIGQFTTGTIGQGTYKLCLAALGFPNLSYPAPNNYHTLQVVLYKDSSSNPEKIVGEFNIPPNNGSSPWKNYGNVFTISASDAGQYDRIQLRFDDTSQTSYQQGVFIDNVIIGPVASTPSPCDGKSYDLASFDNAADVGAEPYFPNTINWNVWMSNDIWNRKTSNGLSLTPENPAYSPIPKHNVMRFRVKNIGYVVSQPSYARLYWAIGATGESWDTNPNPITPPLTTAKNSWDGSKCIMNPITNTCVTAGGELKDVSNDFNPNAQPYVPSKGFPIPPLQPGQEYIIDANWHPVNPSAFGDPAIIKNPMICFLGRINDIYDPMYGEYATSPSTPFSNNIKNNNNIVTRNTTVVRMGRYEGFYDFFSVYAGNNTKTDIPFNLHFGEITTNGSPFENIGLVKVKLDELLWSKWIAGGASGNGIQIYNTEKRELLINPTSAQLNNITLKAGEYRALSFSFGLKADNTNISDYQFTFSQRLSSNPDSEYGSVCNFLVALNGAEESGVPLCDEGKDCTTSAPANSFKGDLTLSPNPSTENTALNFELINENSITVAVADMYGKIVKTLANNQYYKAGMHSIRFSTSELQTGVYVVAVSANNEKRSIQLIVKH